MNKRYSDPHERPYISTSVDLEAMLETQIKANLKLTKRLSEKDKLIHSLAYDLINCSQSVELASKPFFNKDALKYRTIGKKALDSITDKGEKDE